MAIRTGPTCPTCLALTFLVELRYPVAYWYCRACRQEVPAFGDMVARHSMEPCPECAGLVAHSWHCPIGFPPRKKGRFER